MIEKDFTSEFNMIIKQYRMSPFGFRLRKTGCILKLIENNGLLYLDLINLYKIVCEMLGPNIPEEIIDFIRKITFSEIITVERNNSKESKPVTCVQFIDESFFERCQEWIESKNKEIPNPNQELFFENSNEMLPLFNMNSNESSSQIKEMSPFNDSRNKMFFDILDDNSLGFQNKDNFMSTKPRGKQMIMVGENLKNRPFICEVPFCDRAFKRYEHLKRHMKMHTGDRPYKCTVPGCNKSFSRSDNLNQHQKTHLTGYKEKSTIRFKNEKPFHL